MSKEGMVKPFKTCSCAEIIEKEIVTTDTRSLFTFKKVYIFPFSVFPLCVNVDTVCYTLSSPNMVFISRSLATEQSTKGL